MDAKPGKIFKDFEYSDFGKYIGENIPSNL